MITTDIFKAHVDSDYRHRERRHSVWTEIYELYRNKVITNRLTQRQSVNVPLMKETIRARLAQKGDPIDLHFDCLDQDPEVAQQREIFMNEYWLDTAEHNKLDIRDMVDKKQEELYGRSLMKLNVVGGRITIEVIDPFDILVDRYVDPADIETARRITHLHIYRALGELDRNALYDRDAISRLRAFFATKRGLIKAEQNVQAAREKNQRLADLGVPDIDNPALGETYVELNEMLYREWDPARKETVTRLAVMAEGEILTDRPLAEVLNVDFYPYVTMASDVERTDFWSDGTGDITLTPNKILNVWMSQLTENRTLRNFGMQYFDSTNEKFNPRTFVPAPFGWYPVPGKPDDMVKRIEIPELSESLDEMNFVIAMNERATAATGIVKGTGPERETTLGEFNKLAAMAAERIGSDDTYILRRNRDLGEKFWKLAEANADKLDAVKLHKKSASGAYWEREVSPSDWKSGTGYKVRVVSKAKKDQEQLDQLSRMTAVRNLFPGNAAFDRSLKEIALDIVNLDQDRRKEVLEADEQVASQLAALRAPPQVAPVPMSAGA